MRIAEITMFILVILLTISVGLNVFQYTGRKPDPNPEIVTVVDTVVRVDTILRVETNQVFIERPIPVKVDSVKNTKIYRDTIFHQYGTIQREEIVFGDLLRKDIKFDFQIPETIKTIEITKTNTEYVRRGLLLGTVGFQSNFVDLYSPTVGGQYIFRGHDFAISYNYTLGLKQHQFGVGFRIPF